VARSYDVFCHVVDNFGDAAVCWRLSRGLAELPARPSVRLWIDDLNALRTLVPELRTDAPHQSRAGIEIVHLRADADFGAPAEVAVDAFGGGLPEVYTQAMVRREAEPGGRSLWIVLEYLSAEPWVATHHGLPSPHPRLPLRRHFFFPGFTAQSGGLLRETGLDQRRQAFLADPGRQTALWRDAGFAPPPAGTTLVTLFGYEQAPIDELLEVWVRGAEPILAAVPTSRLEPAVAAFMGAAGSAAAPLAGRSLRRGSLEVRFLPFLPQDRYDELLWAADWNFVRGEDSFVRAQWAERAFVWQLYPQAGGAHLAKLEAFLDLYCVGLDAKPAAALRNLFRVWNAAQAGPAGPRRAEIARAWTALAAHNGQLPGELRRHARNWASRAAAAGDLATNLARFCAERLECPAF